MNKQNIHTMRILRKEKVMEYLIPGTFGGFVLGMIFFFISLFENSLTDSLKTGFVIWIVIILLYTSVGFFSEEWYRRKKKLKKFLKYKKYRNLFDLGLKINDDLEFVGNINNYNIRFYLHEKYLKPNKYIDKHFIDIYCIPKSFDNFQNILDKIKNISGIENAVWGYGIFSIGYKENANNFIFPLDLILKYLTEESIIPLSKPDWESSFKKEIISKREREEKARTKQVIKIGKLDIKYVKSKNAST